MRGVIALVATIVLAGLANGDEPSQGWVYIQKLGEGTFEIDTREERLQLINEMRVHIANINSVIPNPTPEVRAWVEQEGVDALNATPFSPERHSAWLSSKEYAHVELKALHETLMAWTKCVIDAARVSYEMYCWAGLAATLASEGVHLLDYIQRLEKHKIIPESRASFALLYSTWSTNISHQIVIRYLLILDQKPALIR